jgi:VCBS repeat-containing protein
MEAQPSIELAGVCMQRASRYAIVGALFCGLVSVLPIGSALMSVHAAPGLSLLTGRPIGSSMGAPPARSGVSLIDRLLRRPRAMFGSPVAPPAVFGLRFDGVDDRVTFGPAPALGSPTFTLEAWIMREGAGKTAATGGSGAFVTAVPIITKGVAEVDGSNKDANYFFGIDGATQVLAADFEDTATGANHPVLGTARIWPGVWYHVAATYDGTTWNLYVNGNLDKTLAVGNFTPRFDSIQHAALGGAINSAGTVTGAFQGQMDEPRIWKVARTQAQIQATMGAAVTSDANLLGRWSLDEGTGTVATNSIITSPVSNGTLAPAAGPVWVAGGAPPFVASSSPGPYALRLSGTPPGNEYVTFGAAPGLGAATFTIETWFKREGTGQTTTTGALTAIPLVTKGRGEADNSNVDLNYFLGINPTGGPTSNPVIAADFEDMPVGATPGGANHPINGVTTIVTGTWYHAAVTYDGTNLTLYLNGALEGTLAVGKTPRFDSIQHAALGSALTSTGAAAGFFAGALDEARIWNYARTPAQLLNGKDREIPTANGLLGRWSFNDWGGATFIEQDSSGHNQTGTIIGPNWMLVSSGVSFSTTPNLPPVVNAGPDQAVAMPAAAVLVGSMTDDNVTGGPLTAAWSKTSGPGTVIFSNPTSAITNATFSAPGSYVLTLVGDDGELSSSDTVSVEVTGVTNLAPVVNVGPDQSITLPANIVTLPGSVTDDGVPGPTVTTLWTKVSGPGPVTFADATAPTTDATFVIEGTYVLQLLANDSQLTGTDTITVTVNPNPVNKGILFGGTNAYVTMGPAPQLGAPQFTVEGWVRRDGTGVATSTGTNGVNAVPLITKGRAEAEASNVDMNYFLGIDNTTGKLAVDFEEGPAGISPGNNHPLIGGTVLQTNVWYHVAATYDGSILRLFVNGGADGQLTVGQPPRSDSIQHFGIGSALNSTGVAAGFFNGAMDEVRVWNYARSAAQILSGKNREIPSASGLVGRWGLNENSGTTANDSSASHVNGTITGANWSWVSGGPFAGALNAPPVVDAGPDQIVTLPTPGTLIGSAIDDGITGTPVTTLWTKTSGPGNVFFGNAAAGSTSVDFSATGTYVLTLTASDGELSASDDITVTVGGTPNLPPTVDAGVDQTITLPVNVVSVSGTATDDGVPGPSVTTQWSKVSGPGSVTFSNAAALATSATFSMSGAYVLQLAANDGLLTGTDTLTVNVLPNPANKAIQFTATGTYVTFGAAPGLGAQKFTLETWFRRDGPGMGTFTGTGGITAVPLITKGMAEVDGNNKDMNYFLGIDSGTGKLVADFEDINGTPLGGNHPVSGTTVIPADGVWRHAAVTYDGTTWRVYLNGVLETTLAVGTFTPRFDSIQHAALGTALNSTGAVTSGQTAGFFNGVLDEARIWNYARSDQQIGRGRFLEIPVATPGLLARWGLNEGSGTAVGDSSGHAVSGTIIGSNFSWVAGASFIGSNTNPAAADDAATTSEDTPVTIAVLGNDSDADGDVLAILAVGAPGHGTAAANANGTITYTPAANYNGADSFTYSISDSQGGSATATVAVTISPSNDAPVAADDTYSTSEDTALVVGAPGVLANDTDVDGDSLSATLVSGPSHGTLTLNANGSFTYTPAADYNGPDSFTYKAGDGTLNSNVATASITVTAVNDAPTGGADSYTLAEDTSLVVEAPGVLLNDTDVEGDSLSAIPVGGPSHGTLTLNADGSFSYTPAANFNGTDTFTYRANDGAADSALVTVTLTVTPVNDSPVAADDSVTTDEDVAVVIHVLDNDSDVDGDALTVSVVGGPAHGSAVVNPNGTVTYTPAADYHGPDGFTYSIDDGHGGTATASVGITVTSVNDAPVAVPDGATTSEDGPVTIDVLSNDADVDGDAVAIASVGSAGHGTVVVNPNGTITYTPAANYNGLDSFSYSITDGHGGIGSAVVSITVTPVNDAPGAADDSYSTNEDTALVVPAPGVLGNDSDVDGDAMSAILVNGPSHGTLALNQDGSFTYTPAANFNGSDSFSYKASDGSLESAPATVTIVVNPVNDAPIAVDDSYAVNEDTLLTISAPGVLGNDTDTENSALTAILVNGPASGTLTLNPDGSFSYQPGPDFNGTDSFTYKSSDGSLESAPATVTILVTPVDDAPLAVDDHYGMNEDGTLAIAAPGLLANDLDVDSSSLMVQLASAPAHGTLTLNPDGSFSYSPNADYNGADSFTYKVSDGALESAPATVNITINAINDAPVAAADSFTSSEDATLVVLAPGVLGNDTDAEGDSMTASLVSGPSHGTLTFNADGSFNYLPAPNYNGADSFTYKASDGTADSNVATVTITIGGVNDPPVANDDSFTVNEDTPLTVGVPGVLANDTDADGNTLTAIHVSGPSHGTLALNGDGSFSYTPAANYNGPDSFTYRVNDGTADSNVATVSITVNAVDDAPVAGNNNYTTNENTALTVSAPGVLGNDTDVEGDPLTAILVSGPSHGTLALNANGGFTYTPTANYNGLDSFTYKANDGTADSNTATVTIAVSAVNSGPGAVNDSYATAEDTPLTIAAPGVLGNDTDLEGDALTAILVSGPSHGTLTLNANGGFTYTPAADYNGLDSFSYKSNDGTADSNIATVTITISPVNDAPVANNNSYSTNEDVTLTVNAPGVLGNDTDVDGDPLSAILVSGPSHGTLTLNANGSFTYTSAANYNGPDSFTYKANDGVADSNVATVTITVNPVNDPPVAASDSYSTNEDTTLTVGVPGVLGNDTDVDSPTLTAIKMSNPAHGTVTLNANGSFTYTPSANYNGPDSFTYVANDGTANSSIATVTISVIAVNDAPVANNQFASLSEDGSKALTLTATDVDGNPLTYSIVTPPAHGTLSGAAPNVTYVPAANYNGPDSFTFKANDGLLDSNIATVSLTVNSVNDPPVAQSASYTTPVNTPLTGTVIATDVEGSTLTYFITNQPAKGTVTLNPATGAFTYTPKAGKTGPDSFRFKANDGTANSNVARIDIRIQ